MTVLLHLVREPDWARLQEAGQVDPLPEVGFVHLSTPEQVHLPADRLFAGADDLLLLVLDPARIVPEVRWEPGVPGDLESMRFPHAYGSVGVDAVDRVVPYRAGPDGYGPPVLD